MKRDSSNRPHLLISVQLGMGVRNFLLGDLLPNLAKDWAITVSTPFARDPRFIADFAIPGVVYDAAPLKGLRGPWGRWMYALEYLELWKRHKPQTPTKFVLKERDSSPAIHWFKNFVLKLIGKRLGKTESWISDRAYLCRFPASWGKIDAVLVLTTDNVYDRKLWYSARRQNIPVAVMPHSWDNLPGRGTFPLPADLLLVWNELMREQALTLHQQPASSIEVVGVPQYQLYANLSPLDRSETLRLLNIPPDAKYILYAANSIQVVPDEADFVKSLVEKLPDLGEDIFLVIRTHPNDRRDLYQELYSNHPKIRINHSNELFAAKADHPKKDMTSVREFGGILKHAEVAIHYFSTIGIDAAFFGTPSVIPTYNQNYPIHHWNSAPRWAETNHYQNILQHKLLRTAGNLDEVILQTKQLLQNKFADDSALVKLVDQQITKLNPETAIPLALARLKSGTV